MLANKLSSSADRTSVRGNSWPKLRALLGDWSGDGRSFHLTLWGNNNSGIVLEVEEITFSSSISFSLSDNDSWHDLLSKFWLTSLDRCEEQFSNGTFWQSVESGADHSNSNDVQVLGTGVVSAVHNTSGWNTA